MFIDTGVNFLELLELYCCLGKSLLFHNGKNGLMSAQRLWLSPPSTPNLTSM